MQPWKPLKDGKRITKLKNNDQDVPEINRTLDETEKARKLEKLLLKRNSQLHKVIQIITNFLHFTKLKS